jgi:hypothetical protein
MLNAPGLPVSVLRPLRTEQCKKIHMKKNLIPSVSPAGTTRFPRARRFWSGLLAICSSLVLTATVLAGPAGQGAGAVTDVSGDCAVKHPAQGGGPDNWEVVRGGSYSMTISGVTECDGNTITVFIQNSANGNFCFNATLGDPETYTGTFTMPEGACFTSPISYKCGADQSCDNSDAYDAKGPFGANSVHLRASTFSGTCEWLGKEETCDPIVNCPGFSVSLDNLEICITELDKAKLTASVTYGGMNTLHYAWKIDGNPVVPANDSDTITITAAGTYTVTVTEEGTDCTATDSAVVQVLTDCEQQGCLGSCPEPVTVECGTDPLVPADDLPSCISPDCELVTLDPTTLEGDCTDDVVLIITQHWRCVNKNTGLYTSCNREIKVKDTTAPTIKCPDPIKVAHDEGECCASVPFEATADDCSETTIKYTIKDENGEDVEIKSGEYCFPVGTTTVTAVAKDRCGRLSDPCNFDVTVTTEICGTKFNDTDASGKQNGTEVGIGGWLIVLKQGDTVVDSQFTGDDGEYCFTGLAPGTYTVLEAAPNQANWVPTTPTSVEVKDLSCPVTVDFGNVCLGGGGGLTLGFWSNKNGQKLTTAADLLYLSGLCLSTAAGGDFNPTTTGQLSSFLLGANAVNMANMLSAQLAAMEMNVRKGFVLSTAVVYNPCLGFITIGNLLAQAEAALCADRNTPSGDEPNRGTQTCLKNTLDAANNNLNFVQGTPCPHTFPE